MGLFDQFFFVSCLVCLQFLRFQMTPNPLIRIEIRRVRRQVKQLQPFLAGDESLYTFGDVWACLICNHKDLSSRIFGEQLFEEVNEYSGIDSLRWNLEKQSSLQAQSAHDQYAGSLARNANYRSLSHRCPGSAHRWSQSNHRLVFEEEQSALLPGQTLDPRPFGRDPSSTRFRILFQGTPFRLLTTEL